MGALVAVVEAGGFSAAARRTGAKKALLSRKVRELEERLGVQLLTRTTRAIQLTEEGRDYFAHARRALQAAREAEESLSAGRGAPRGLLRVSTTAVLGELLLEPVALRYLARYPRVSLELDLSSRSVDLIREGFDVAIRAGALPDSSLRALRLGAGRSIYVASPAYLARRGAPNDPDALGAHALIGIGSGPLEWLFARAGKISRLVVQPRLLSTSYDLAVRAAVAGLGITRVPDFYVRGPLAEGRLSPVLDAWTPGESPIHVLTPPGIQPPKTRAFVQLVAQHLGRGVWRGDPTEPEPLLG